MLLNHFVDNAGGLIILQCIAARHRRSVKIAERSLAIAAFANDGIWTATIKSELTEMRRAKLGQNESRVVCGIHSFESARFVAV
jgi:hypothetical protein